MPNTVYLSQKSFNTAVLMISNLLSTPRLPQTLVAGFLVFILSTFLPAACGKTPKPHADDQDTVWQVPVRQNLMPHFEEANGRKMLFVDGRPFTVLAVEIPWWDLIYGKTAETMNTYDYLYPAAEAMGMNALKVPVKWSMVEPKQGVYDFSYLDHAKSMAEKHHLRLILDWFGHYASGDGTIYGNLTGELYAPYYIVSDEKTYPRAVDADGGAHHNTVSYNYPPAVDREVAAFRAFMEHIRQVDSQTYTILMIQVENEIAVFGADRRNRKLWRDHSPASNKLFAQKGIADELQFSAWNLSWNWIRPLTNAGADIYPLPFFHNYVGGKLEDGIVGGAPGEDVATYLENCPRITFIGLNLYAAAETSAEKLRATLGAYRVKRNLPAITETNSGNDPVAPRLAYIAVGEFGAPIFAPWSLSVSYPTSFQPYVLPDGTLANGAYALRDTFTSLAMALPQVSYHAGTSKLKVFMADLPGKKFSETAEVNGFELTVSGENNGQAIVIHPSGHEFLIVGYRCGVSFHDSTFHWPAMEHVRVEKGFFTGNEWKQEGAPDYTIDQSHSALEINLDAPQVVRVFW